MVEELLENENKASKLAVENNFDDEIIQIYI